MYANDPAVPEATREVLRRFAPSLIRLRELDEDRYRSAFGLLVPCEERTLLSKLYADLNLRPFIEKNVDSIGSSAHGALYVAAPAERVRDAVTEVYRTRGLERAPWYMDEDRLVPESRHVEARTWPPAELERWHDDIVVVLPEPCLVLPAPPRSTHARRQATCVGSREWEIVAPGQNELAADLSRSFPVLAVTQTDAFQEVSLYCEGSCEASRVVSSIAKYRNASRGKLPSYAELAEMFDLDIADIAPGELLPKDMSNQGYSNDVTIVYDSYAHDYEDLHIQEILRFVRAPAAPAERRAANAKSGEEAMLATVVNFERAHRSAAPGDVIPFASYLGNGGALNDLADGGTLFLVTVRPNDRLWLVAVLDQPMCDDDGAFEDERWKAPVNRVPITDITDRIDRIVFANGSSLTFLPGQLGTSLQAPRALASATVHFLRSCAGGLGGADEASPKRADETTPSTEESSDVVRSPKASSQGGETTAKTKTKAKAKAKKAVPVRRGEATASSGGETVLAIVAKGVFEKEHPDATPGDVLPFGAYVSKNAALKKVAGGGTLFLVTVRPNDRLWLVAILEQPTFDGERWTAPVNRVPVTDLTEAIARMTFASGASLAFRPGQLGMSLQTPRVLAPATVGLLRSSSGSLDRP